MRTFVIAMVAAMAATSATAMDLSVPGLALNTDVVAEYKLDAETTTVTINPELALEPVTAPGLELTAGMTLSAYDNAGGVTLFDEFDVLPSVDFGATYTLPTWSNVELSAGTSYDFDAKERGEVSLKATFSF